MIMISRLAVLLLCGVISAHLGSAQKMPKVKKLNMKVHINITGETLVMKFHRPNQDLKLEGFILGYGSNYFSNQYFQWPDNGKPYIADVDAETRYLIAVKPNENPKKICKDKNSTQKPLQLVIGTLTPTSVYLSWGILINPQVDWSELNKCPNDRYYTVRYREKNKDWNFQLCPTTETVVDNLKPNTMYEFGVKDNEDDSIWGKCLNYKTIPKGKENGNMENNYKIPKGTLQYASEDTKALVPVMVVKQGFQNITKSAPAPPPTEPVFKETKKPPMTTPRPTTPKPKLVSKVTASPPPVPKPTEKAVAEDPKPAVTAQPIVESFTPDSSTGTLEWVRATMVTHPFIQVTNIQNDSSVIDEQSEQSAPFVHVQESQVAPTEAPNIATKESLPKLKPTQNMIAPTETKLSESEVLSSTEEPQTKLESDQLVTYMPEAKRSQSKIPATTSKTTRAKQSTRSPKTHTKTTTAFFGSENVITTSQGIVRTAVRHPIPAYEEPVSTEAPLLNSEFNQEHTPLPAGNEPLSFDEQAVSTDSPLKRHTTSATTGKTIQAKKRTQPPKPHSKTTTEFIGRDTVISTSQGMVRTTVPHPIPGEVPLLFDEQEVSTDTPIKLPTTSGSYPVSTVVSKLSTHSPYQTHTTVLATTGKTIQSKKRTHTPKPHSKTTTEFIGRDTVISTSQGMVRTTVPHLITEFIGRDTVISSSQDMVRTTVPHPIPVPTEMSLLHPKPGPGTEEPDHGDDSTQPESEINTSETPQMFEPETTSLVSDDQTDLPVISQKLTTEAKLHTSIAYRTTSVPFTTNTPTSSERTQSTQAPKSKQTPGVQPKRTLPKQAEPIDVFKATKSSIFTEETPITVVPAATRKYHPKKTFSTVGPAPHFVPGKTEKAISSKLEKTSQSPPTTAVPKPAKNKTMPINLIRIEIVDDPDLPSVQEIAEKAVSSIFEKPSQSPPTTVSKPPQTKKMPINLIMLHIFGVPTVPSVENNTQSTSPSTPKITNKISQLKLVPNTTLTPSQSSTTLKPSTTTPVPTQKAIQPKTPKPKPTPRTRTKPAPTAAAKDTTTKPKIPHVTVPATLAPYKVQHSSSRPRTPLRPRTRPAQNGTAQGTNRPRPTGDFNWAPGTIPGGRILDNAKILGVSRNISMEPNNTGKKTFSVSSAPLPPIRPTSIRRRIQASNVTGKPAVTVSSPPLPPVKPTNIRRRPPVNGTGRAAPPVDANVFSPAPVSDIDALGQPRYTAPHVKYVSKEDNVPCSITETLKYFPVEEGTNQEAITPPQNPPANLSVVTVEGCPSFVIIDWEQPDNDTVTEYKVISTENGGPPGKDQSIITTNQTYSTVENLKPNTSYEFKVVPTNPLGEGPVSTTVEFSTESADPRVSEPVTGGKDAIWTEIKFKSDSYSECKGKQYVKRTWYKKFVGIQLCNSLRYKIYLSDTLTGTFYNIGDQSGFGEDHCQFVDSFLDGRTGQRLLPEQLTNRKGFYRSVRQQPVEFGEIGSRTYTSYVHWYECGISIPGKW